MESKLNFYDFVGYIIPGTIVLGMIYWALIELFKITLAFDTLGTIGEPIVFLMISYLCGHILSALGKNIEEKGKFVKWTTGFTIKGYLFSKEYLKDKDEHYSKEFKNKLKLALYEVWDIKAYDEDVEKQYQILFELSNKLCIQENLNPQIEIFNSFYGFYRNLLVAFSLSMLVSYVILIKNIVSQVEIFYNFILCDYTCCYSRYFYSRCNLSGILLPILLIIILHVIRKPFESRQKIYGEKYADSIYKSFFAWYRKNQILNKRIKKDSF